MDFVVLLSLLAITQTIVLARPSDMPSNTKGLEDDVKETIRKLRYNFPSNVHDRFRVTINGTMNISTPMIEAVILAAGSDVPVCTLSYYYDAEKKIFQVEPSDETPSTEYDLMLNDSQVSDIPFVIKITAGFTMGQNGDNYMFKIIFDGNNVGESRELICQIQSFEDIKYIVFQNGIIKINSLLFEFPDK